ncbi:MAG: Mediator of RNA polymerase II transcription subunit 7 [Candelina mexicana]|nr:MAG: Mediator of RNA polymerase II transcription subunit 7 [Candelina mexicana]
MTDEQQGNAVSAAYPAPPPFYRHFTPQNLSRLKEAQRSQPLDSNTLTQQDDAPRTNLPPELRFLIPPEPPSAGLYRNFGDTYNVIDVLPSLKDQGIEQLYPSPPSSPTITAADGTKIIQNFDRAFYLKKMARSLLLNFLELVGTLAVAPEQYGRKIEDLRALFVNAHHLLNEYRPHQARETLIMMMEDQLERSRAETDGIWKMKEKVEGVLTGLGGGEGVLNVEDSKEKARAEYEAKRRNEEHKRIWEVLESELG